MRVLLSPERLQLMPNYKEVTGTFHEYQRARLIQINNEYGKTPTITFVEEVVSDINGKQTHSDVSQLTASYDPAGNIPLINPQTDEPIGTTMTHQDLFVAVYSLYRQLAVERDNAPVATP